MRRLGSLAVLFLLAIAPEASASWRVVTFDRTVQAADRGALDVAGASNVQSLGGRRYVAWVDGRASARLRAAAHVSSVRELSVLERVSPSLGASAARAVVVRRVRGERVADVVDLAGLGGPAALARRSDVLYVGPAPTAFLPEDEGTAQMLAGREPVPGYRDTLAELGVDGTGSRIAVVDTGVDETHPDLEDRVVDEVFYQPSNTPATEDGEGHGTHVAGIVAGTGAAPGQDTTGASYGQGVAPGASLIASNGISSLSPTPRETLPLLAFDAVKRDALAWNASWHTGEGTGVGYVENSRVLDALVRDADGTRPGNQQLAMVFSAGNEGSGKHTITSPKEAKNIITVASSRSHRLGADGVLSPDTTAISYFSSRGPARDGRVLPTVTAPGEVIASARARPSGGLCFEPTYDGPGPLHSICSGTSMAAPHVAGAVALIGQWWRGVNGGRNPSPAFLKALLVNTAADLGKKDVPNQNEGWGIVNTTDAIRGGSSRVHLDETDVLGNPGEQRTFRVEAIDPSKPLRVSLAWTDAPGAPFAGKRSANKPDPAVLVNDLDLAVSGGGTTWHGNQFKGGLSEPGGSPNRLDNVENVFLSDAAARSYEVSVRAHALPGDGVPQTGDATDQDYALVIANARLLPAVDAVPTLTGAPVSASAPQAAAPAPAAAAARTRISARWSRRARRAHLRRVVVRDVPRGGKVEVLCRGKRCPRKRAWFRLASGGRIDVGSPLRGRIGRGAVVTVRVTAAGSPRTQRRWRVKRGGRVRGLR